MTLQDQGVDGQVPDRAERRGYAEDYLDRHQEVQGWLEEIAARATDMLLQAQTSLGLHGDVLEIGVHHGRYFLILANGLVDDEIAVAVDLFDDQGANLTRSGRGSWTHLVWNAARFAPLARMEIIQGTSTHLHERLISRNRMRFVSIDGGHDRATCCSDLWLAQRVTGSGGIVALDDIYRVDWSGVTAGVARYYREGGALVPFAFVPNKLLLTTDTHWAERYREALRREFGPYCDRDHPSLECFEFDDVLLVLNHPKT